MARASSSFQCDSVATYMDGVQVQITEAYKLPKKITPSTAYYSKLPDVSKYSYDFSLEQNVLEKMKEWRKARISYVEARKVRLEEKRKKEVEKVSLPSSPNPNSTQLNISVNPTADQNFYTPQYLPPPGNDIQNNTQVNGVDYSALDYSFIRSFDNDTSSPFDNMMLKAMNNTEELAQMLQQPTTVGTSHPTSQWAPTSHLESMMNNLAMDNKMEEIKGEPVANEFTENGESAANKLTDQKNHPVSLIVEELKKELDRPKQENWQPWPDDSPVADKSLSTSKDRMLKIDPKELARTLADLSPENQKLAKHLSDMGFPLSRVARAIQDLEGQDNKKIVEYLLAIQSLEDLGMTEDAAVKTLALFQYDQQKAKVYYESLCTLRDLGFPEDKASMALLKCNIDRDSALDLLIS